MSTRNDSAAHLHDQAALQADLAAGRLDRDPEDERTVDLLGLLVIFLAEWKIGIAVAFLTFIAGAVYTFHTPAQFVATASILPKQSVAQSNSLSALFTGGHPADLYTGLLRSRSVTDDVIRELNLIPPGSTQGWEGTRDGLLGSMTVVVGADGLIRISVRSTDARMAMKVTNAYINALHQQQQTMALSQSVLNRQFYEQQLDQEKQALILAENDLEQLQKKTGIIDSGTQTQTGLSQIAGTGSQITALEVQLAALLQSETEQNPQVQTLRSQIAKLRSQQQILQASGSAGAGTPVAAGRAPAVNLEFERKQRAVKFHEGLLSSLSTQYQNALLVEASSVDAFQVVDYPIEPEHQSFPPRRLWLLFSAGFAAFLGSVAILFVLLKRRVQADADYQRHMLAIRQNFGFKR